ncbi:MAG: hypothetical protein AAFY71_16000 [Bacteroidota bacterium]
MNKRRMRIPIYLGVVGAFCLATGYTYRETGLEGENFLFLMGFGILTLAGLIALFMVITNKE